MDNAVDTTGGHKTTSIVGAASTFRRETTFQYVDTNDPYQVHLYDFQLEPAPELGL